MEYASTPLHPPASKTIVLQPHQPALKVEPRPNEFTHLEIVLWVIVGAVLFMAPTWLAARGRRLSVGLVNIIFGATVIGWFVALIMAVRSRENAKGGV